MTTLDFLSIAALFVSAIYFTALVTSAAILDQLAIDYDLKPELSSKWLKPLRFVVIQLCAGETAISFFKKKFERKIFENERQKGFAEAFEILKSGKESALKAQAKAIRHDLRSPLAALNSVIDALKIPDDLVVRTLKTATRRIKEIIEELEETDEKKERLQFVILEETFHESFLAFQKRNESNREVKLKFNHSNLCPVLLPRQKFIERMEDFLNLLDSNMDSTGKVFIEITKESRDCRIDIFVSESTKPLEREEISSLAKFISSIDGSLRPLAGQDKLLLQLRIPLSDVGVRFVGPAILKNVVLIDDDKGATKSLLNWNAHIVASSLTFEDAKPLLAKSYDEDPLFLVDYRLNQNQFGTDLIPQSPNKSRCILCSFDFDTRDLQDKAKALGVPVMVKTMINSLLLGDARAHDEATKAALGKDPLPSSQSVPESV